MSRAWWLAVAVAAVGAAAGVVAAGRWLEWLKLLDHRLTPARPTRMGSGSRPAGSASGPHGTGMKFRRRFAWVQT